MTLTRDPLGEKFLYWTIVDQKLVSSSQLKSILTYPCFRHQLDQDSLAKYFFYGFVPAPKTIFKKIYKLPAGYRLAVDQKGKPQIKQYWDLDYSKKTNLREAAIKRKVVRLLKKAIGNRLKNDIPGVFLSGGIDSGLVAALMAKLVSPSSIKAFSLGFAEKEADESIYAQKIAKRLGMKHFLKIFSQKEALAVVEKIADILDEPMADPSILPTYFLASWAREEIKVVLSGDGGDENFAGYPKYLAHLFLKKTGLERLPRLNLTRLSLGKFGQFLTYAGYHLRQRNQLWISPFSPEEIRQLTGRQLKLDDLDYYHQLFNGQDFLDEAFFLDQKLTLADLYNLKVSLASRATGLEIGCPFLDQNLVEFCAQIPAKLKLKNWQTKYLLRRIAFDYLPDKIVKRSKMGFGIPLAKWLEGDLRPLVRKHLSKKRIKKQALLNPKTVDKILVQGNVNAVWRLLVFELWAQKWLKN